MKHKGLAWDERTEQVSGRSAIIALGLTQVALGVLLMVRLYIRDQPDSEVRDIQAVFAGSLLVYFALRSYLGGIMPVPTTKQALIAYVGFVGVLFTVLSIWFGLPEWSEWANTILPVVVGPAIVIGGYWLIAWLGRRRVDRQLS